MGWRLTTEKWRLIGSSFNIAHFPECNSKHPLSIVMQYAGKKLELLMPKVRLDIKQIYRSPAEQITTKHAKICIQDEKYCRRLLLT